MYIIKEATRYNINDDGYQCNEIDVTDEFHDFSDWKEFDRQIEGLTDVTFERERERVSCHGFRGENVYFIVCEEV